MQQIEDDPWLAGYVRAVSRVPVWLTLLITLGPIALALVMFIVWLYSVGVVIYL